MSNTDPNKKEPEHEKKRIEIPAWWSIVALIMAGLVFLPIQYANMHGKKTEPAEVKADAADASAAKPEAAAPATEVARIAESAKPAVEAAAAVKEAEPAAKAKEEAAAVETQAAPAAAHHEAHAKTAAAEPVPAPKEAEATPPVKEEVAPPETKAKAAEPAPAKTVLADAGAQTKQVAPPKPQMVQPVALPRTPAEKLKVDNAVVFRVDGKDKAGRPAAFDFVVLSNGYAWALGSTSRIVSDGKAVPEADAADRIFPAKVRDALSGASDLIGVGLASKDGKRADEEARAVARSKTVANWITKVAKPGTSLWALTLGQYDKECKLQEDKDSSFERPVLFAGVRSKAEGTNLQEALADAISNHDNLPSRECYSRFDMEKVR